MRITSTGAGARPAFYDRNPTAKAFGAYQSANAPHGQTTRANYTVPTGRKFSLGAYLAYFDRATAATTIGFQSALIDYTPSGGGIQYIGMVSFYGSNAGDTTKQNVGSGGLVCGAGDLLHSSDGDASTGGTADYNTSIVGTEFDA
jgi:hypothetical protein